MATRSTIALEYPNGEIRQIYCHWDGYLSNNGKILVESYNDAGKVNELMDLGSLSSLNAEIGVKHPFDAPEFGTPEYDKFKETYGNMCFAYGRDRGEEDTDAQKYKNFDDYCSNFHEEDYNYILRNDGVWYVKSFNDQGFVPLVEAIIEEMRSEEEDD